MNLTNVRVMHFGFLSKKLMLEHLIQCHSYEGPALSRPGMITIHEALHDSLHRDLDIPHLHSKVLTETTCTRCGERIFRNFYKYSSVGWCTTPTTRNSGTSFCGWATRHDPKLLGE